MAKFEINRFYNTTTHKQVVEAKNYAHEGDYFVFYAQTGGGKVLTIASSKVYSIDKLDDEAEQK